MKKIYSLLVFFLAVPFIASAAYSIPLEATTTTGTILTSAAPVNGILPSLLSPFFISSSVTASSTFANGLNIENGCFSINGTCISGGGGSGIAWPWTKLTNWGTTTAATTTAYTAAAYFASSTLASQFPYASTTAFTAGTICLGGTCNSSWAAGGSASSTLLTDNNTFSGTNYFTKNLGLSSTTPDALLSVLQGSDFGSHALQLVVNVASSSGGTATSSLLRLRSDGTLNIGGANFVAFTAGTTGNLQVQGQSSFSNNLFIPTSNQGIFFNTIGTFQGGLVRQTTTNNLVLVPFSNFLSNQNNTFETPAGNWGFGSSSPAAFVAIQANNGVNYPNNMLFTIASSTSLATTTLLSFTNTGVLTLNTPLAVGSGGTNAASFGQGWIYSNGGTGALAASTSPTVNYITSTSTATSTFGGGINLTTGCFAIKGTCLNSASSTLLSDNNTFSGVNVFSKLLNLSATTSALLATDSSGNVIATSSIGTNYITGVLGTINGTSFSVGGSPTITAASSSLLIDNNTFSGALTFGNATSTNFFSSTASSTNLFAQTASFKNASSTIFTCTTCYLTTASSTYASSTFATLGTAWFTNATSTAFAITSLTNKLLSTDANGNVIATTSVGTNLLTGTIGVSNGGTGLSSVGASSTVAISNGSAIAWQQINLGASVYGVLSTANGGTGSSNLGTGVVQAASGVLSAAQPTRLGTIIVYSGGVVLTGTTTSYTGNFGVGATVNQMMCNTTPAGSTAEIQWVYSNSPYTSQVTNYFAASSTPSLVTFSGNNTPAQGATTTISAGNITGSATSVYCTSLSNTATI